MPKYMQIWISRVTIILIIVLLTYGCRSISPSRTSKITPGILLDREREGFYHVVDEGETLSQISKKYNVSIEKIAKVNHLPDKNSIDIGQLIFIPKRIHRYETAEKKIDLGVNFIWPVRGKVISLFSKKEDNFNLGIDIKVPFEKKILAVEDGKVVYSNQVGDEVNKKIVIIQHPENFSTVYVYRGTPLVKAGQQVIQGEPILASGKGKLPSRILHFEVRKHHIPQNPYYFLPR